MKNTHRECSMLRIGELGAQQAPPRPTVYGNPESGSAKQHPSGVGLQPNETRSGIGLAACQVRVKEIRLLHAIQEDGETVVPDENLIPVPLPGTIGHDTLVKRLIWNVVDRAGRAKLLVNVLAWRRASPAKRINLDFETEIHANKSPVIVVDVRRRGVRKSQKDA
jgi:hypothetical protein